MEDDYATFPTFRDRATNMGTFFVWKKIYLRKKEGVKSRNRKQFIVTAHENERTVIKKEEERERI